MEEGLRNWVEQNPLVVDWLDSVSENAKPIYAYRFKAFVDHLSGSGEFEGYDLEDVLDYQDRAIRREKVKIINRLNSFCKELSRELRPATVKAYYSVARSFFSFHGAELPRRRYSLVEEPLEARRQDLKREDLVKIVAAAKPRDRAIYTIAFMGGLGFREFDILNHNSDEIMAQLDSGAEYLQVGLSDRKKLKGKRSGYFTIIGGDGLSLLNEYLKVRGRPHEGEPIFIRSVSGGKGNDDPALEGRSYRKNFKTLCRRVGLPAQGYFPHQVRDVLRTEWQRTGADPLVCEFIMGHGVDPNKYLQFMKAPDYVLEQYRVAESRLNLVSNPDPSMVNRNEMEDLRREVARLQAEKTEAEAITARLEQKYDELIKRIEKLEKPS